MVERKAFIANPKHQYHASQYGEHDCSTHNKKNKDCYEYPSLTYFMDEHQFYAKWSKEKLFLQIQSINSMYPNVESMSTVPIKKWRLLQVSMFAHSTDEY